MCLSPILIPNKNFIPESSCTNIRDNKFFTRFRNNYKLFLINDLTSRYLYVPCGHCLECMQKRQASYRQRVEMECLSSIAFYFTLTYSNDALPSVTTQNGLKTYNYADITDWQNCVKRLRKTNELGLPFKYMIVNEYGTQKKRPHYHGILFFPKSEFVYNTGVYNYDKIRTFEQKLSKILLAQWSRRTRIGAHQYEIKPCLIFKEKIKGHRVFRNFDCQYVEDSRKVSSYITKYLFETPNEAKGAKGNIMYDYLHRLKAELRSVTETAEEEAHLWLLLRCRVRSSHNVGLGWTDEARIYVKDSIQLSIKRGEVYPSISSPIDGRFRPLCSYLYKKVRTLDDVQMFYLNDMDSEYLDCHNEVRYYTREYYDQVDKKNNLQKVIDYQKSLLSLHVDNCIGNLYEEI